MIKKAKEKEMAIVLRKEGQSLNQIAKKLNVAKGSVSVWVRDVDLTTRQKAELNRLGHNSCYNEGDKDKYSKQPKRCDFCGEPLPYAKRKNRFCNCKCAGLANNAKIEKKCFNCGNIARNKFCCTECKLEFHWENRIKEVNKTGMLPTHPRTAKATVLKMRGHQCEICKNKEWMNKKIPLVLDHINGKCKDWRYDNVRLVCGNCDMQLPTFKSKNKNSQRKR